MDMSLIQVQKFEGGLFFMGILIEKLLLVLIATGVLAKYIAIGFIVIMLIQLISYRILNFNIYKTLLRKMEV